MIQLQDVTIRSGTFCLSELSLQVSEGSYTVLMGRTGSGKTTILETICGLRRVASGRIIIRQTDMTDWSPADRGIGYVPQDLALFPTLTVQEHLEFALRLRKWSAQQRAARVTELAERLGIVSLLSRSVRRLSGGEAQRVAIGRALAARPAVLLLDEPLTAVDEGTRQNLQQLLRQISAESGVTALHVTHSRSEALALADQRLILDNGRITVSDS